MQIIIIIFISVVLIDHLSYSSIKKKDMFDPDYIYYTTIGTHDLYIDVYDRIFVFDNGNRKIIVSGGEGIKCNLSELANNIKNIKKDKYENIYVTRPNVSYYTKLIKINKNLVVEELTEKEQGNIILDGLMIYYDDVSHAIIKIDNDIKTTIFSDKNTYYLGKIDEYSFYASNAIIGNDKKDLLYKNGQLLSIDKKDRDKYINIKDIDVKKVSSKKVPLLIEKIDNYIAVVDGDVGSYGLLLDDNQKESEKYYNYLFVYDDGSISYYDTNGDKVKGSLVYLDGNINSNKEPICYTDVFAYYFDDRGKALKAGSIVPTNEGYFLTDDYYRILKNNNFVYDNIDNSNNYSLYNNYFKFGKYEKDDILSNGREKIEWIVLEENESEVLLLSKFVIDYIEINDKFLNDSFYNNAFNSDEKKLIINKYSNNKVFLIDEDKLYYHQNRYNDVNNGWDLMSAISTDYARHKGIEFINENNKYFCHSPYFISNHKIVNSDGSIIDYNQLSRNNGFRPAIWIRKE